MLDFLRAALPWIAIGLSLAIIFANMNKTFKKAAKRKRDYQEKMADSLEDSETIEIDIKDEECSSQSENVEDSMTFYSSRNEHKSPPSEYNENRMNYLPIGMCIGMCVGTALGNSGVFDLGTGISMGMLFGLVIGSFLNRQAEK